MVIKKISLKELRKDLELVFSKDNTLTGFEVKKAIENIFSRLDALEKI